MLLGICLVLCGKLILMTGQSIKKCNYVPEKERFVEVQCNGRKYTKFPLASTLPENTSIISFMDNKIQHLPDQPPQELRDKVWSINLSGNILDELLEDKLGKTFPNVSNLDVSNNNIRLLSKNSFQHLLHLFVLNLSFNKLVFLSQDWFSHLMELSWLDLGHNQISVINETRQGWAKELEKLDLSHNKLRTIPPLPTNAFVSLIRNPIFCECDLGVNKEVFETLIKIDCHQVNVDREPVQIKRKVTKYMKYKPNVNTCQPTGIIDFSFLVAKEKIIITCIASSSYPDAVLFIYHGKHLIKRARKHVSMNSRQPGLYTCKATNYISSDQKELVIPGLTTFSWVEFDKDYTTELKEYDETENTGERLLTTSATQHIDVNITNSKGICLHKINIIFCI